MTDRIKDAGIHDVIIVGGGIAGIALASELNRRGVGAVILEQRQQLVDAGLGINLPGNAIQALNELGVGGELQRTGFQIDRREYRSSKGRLLFKINEAAFWGRDLTPRCVRRADLSAILSKDLPSDIVWNKYKVTETTVLEDSVEVKNASAETLRGKFLVGADGVNSVVRNQCFHHGGKSIALLSNSSWRFLASNPGIDCWTVWMGESAIILLIPLSPREVYCWATITAATDTAGDLEALSRHTRGFAVEPVRVLEEALANPSSVFVSPLTEIRLERWSNERVFLIGDAAHATAPVWAQGAALALEDSLLLARLVAETDDPHRVSDDFHRLRQPRVRHVQAMTDRASKLARVPPFLRNVMMPLLGPLSYRSTYAPLKSSWRNPV